jgi:nucleotide-binding universal stress UspA family protein
MYKHILIPTDGSALSEIAVRQGVALAKSLGASTTAITVTPTFHTFAVEPMALTDTIEQYEKDCKALADISGA